MIMLTCSKQQSNIYAQTLQRQDRGSLAQLEMCTIKIKPTLFQVAV